MSSRLPSTASWSQKIPIAISRISRSLKRWSQKRRSLSVTRSLRAGARQDVHTKVPRRLCLVEIRYSTPQRQQTTSTAPSTYWNSDPGTRTPATVRDCKRPGRMD